MSAVRARARRTSVVANAHSEKWEEGAESNASSPGHDDESVPDATRARSRSSAASRPSERNRHHLSMASNGSTASKPAVHSRSRSTGIFEFDADALHDEGDQDDDASTTQRPRAHGMAQANGSNSDSGSRSPSMSGSVRSTRGLSIITTQADDATDLGATTTAGAITDTEPPKRAWARAHHRRQRSHLDGTGIRAGLHGIVASDSNLPDGTATASAQSKSEALKKYFENKYSSDYRNVGYFARQRSLRQGTQSQAKQQPVTRPHTYTSGANHANGTHLSAKTNNTLAAPAATPRGRGRGRRLSVFTRKVQGIFQRSSNKNKQRRVMEANEHRPEFMVDPADAKRPTQEASPSQVDSPSVNAQETSQSVSQMDLTGGSMDATEDVPAADSNVWKNNDATNMYRRKAIIHGAGASLHYDPMSDSDAQPDSPTAANPADPAAAAAESPLRARRRMMAARKAKHEAAAKLKKQEEEEAAAATERERQHVRQRANRASRLSMRNDLMLDAASAPTMNETLGGIDEEASDADQSEDTVGPLARFTHLPGKMKVLRGTSTRSMDSASSRDILSRSRTSPRSATQVDPVSPEGGPPTNVSMDEDIQEAIAEIRSLSDSRFALLESHMDRLSAELHSVNVPVSAEVDALRHKMHAVEHIHSDLRHDLDARLHKIESEMTAMIRAQRNNLKNICALMKNSNRMAESKPSRSCNDILLIVISWFVVGLATVVEPFTFVYNTIADFASRGPMLSREPDVDPRQKKLLVREDSMDRLDQDGEPEGGRQRSSSVGMDKRRLASRRSRLSRDGSNIGMHGGESPFAHRSPRSVVSGTSSGSPSPNYAGGRRRGHSRSRTASPMTFPPPLLRPRTSQVT